MLDEDRRSLDPVAREELAPVVARRLQRAPVVEGRGPDEHQRAVRARAVGRRDLRDLDPGHRRRADGAEGDDLDLLLGIAVAVVHLVLGVEALDDHRLVLLRHRAVGHRRAQLEALAVIPALGDELDHLVGARDPVRVELLGHHLAQLLAGGVEAVEIRVGGGAELDEARLGVLVPEIGLEEADRRGDAGRDRDDHVPRRDRFRQRHAMQRARAAERHDREVARVEAAGNRVRADRQRHVVVDDLEDPERGIGHAEAERLRHLLLDRLARQVRVELQVAAERQVGVEAAEHDLGVGHGRLLAAAAVAGRPGLRAGRARADVEAARLVDVGDRAAAGADRHEIDHRRQHRMAADVGVTRVHDFHGAARDRRDVGRGAADVDGDDVRNTGHLALGGAPDDAARRAGHQDANRPLGAGLDGRDATVRLHDPELRADAGAPQAGLEIVEVEGGLRADIAVHRRGREALVLAHHLRDLAREGDVGVRHFLEHDLPGAALMGVVEEGEHEADHHRLDPAPPEDRAGRADRLLVERGLDLAGRRQDALCGSRSGSGA